MSDVIGTKTIELNGHKITIKKLPIRKLVGLLEVVKTLPDSFKDQISKIDGSISDQNFIFEELPGMVVMAMDEMAKFVIKAANSDELTEEILLDELGADDGILLILEILEVNNAKVIIERIKKAAALYQSVTVKPSNPMLKQTNG